MGSTYGENIKLNIFGSSHGPEIGMTLEGIPAGLPVDIEQLQQFLNRRAPGRNPWSTGRTEGDVPHFLSGITDGRTNGSTIRAIIYNENVRKSDYIALANTPRPGHADYTAWVKYGPEFDMSGGGPFSGRMTAPMCIAGGLCKQWLEARSIRIGAHILAIGPISDHCFDPLSPQFNVVAQDFPVVDATIASEMIRCILAAKDGGDSVGGRIECAAIGVPAGIGGPMFGSVKAKIASILYAIPAVREVSFGHDTEFLGSANNDAYTIQDGRVCTQTNNCGGILGGITNGMPLITRVSVKPTPSIARPQQSVNLMTMEEVTVQVNGRHDPCIVPRAVPVVEAATAIALFDLILGEGA